MEINAIIQAVQTGLPEAEVKLLQQQLQQHINHLINNDFERLVQVLYTVDVDEKKLKTLLHEHKDVDAAQIISELIIQRQLQKQQTKADFKNQWNAEDEERW
jgi:hypothetical protein